MFLMSDFLNAGSQTVLEFWVKSSCACMNQTWERVNKVKTSETRVCSSIFCLQLFKIKIYTIGGYLILSTEIIHI